ncbi:unnamed protein product [Arabidopsis lyrata]|nr:unnamed protein product [Arabidopsis lyrata]
MMDPTMMVLQKLMYEVVIQGSKHHHGQIRHPTYVFLGQQGYWTIEKWSSIYDGILGGGDIGIQTIHFEYVKLKSGELFGVWDSGFTQTIEIDHLNNEHLESVEGYYNNTSFKGKIIIWFHGYIRSRTCPLVNSLEAYFTWIPASKLEAKGSKGGTQWDDGADHEDYKRFLAGGMFEIDHLNNEHLDKKFSLAHKGRKIIGFHGYAEKNLISLGAYSTTVSVSKSVCHGSKLNEYWDDGVFDGIRKVCEASAREEVEEFELDYPNEFITSVDGTFKYSSIRKVNCVTSLVFKTSKGKISPTFGSVTGTKFVLETKGCALVGFHGWTFLPYLTAIGAYFSPLPLPPTAEKLESQGYDRGAFWDDGVYDGVRKIYVGQRENGIAFLLEKEGYKIAGFHGKASSMIRQLGVHVMPIIH